MMDGLTLYLWAKSVNANSQGMVNGLHNFFFYPKYADIFPVSLEKQAL